MPLPPRPLWLDHPNNIYSKVQVMKLFIMHPYLASSQLLPLRPKYSPQHPVLKQLLSPNVTGRISHSYESKSDTILCILFFKL